MSFLVNANHNHCDPWTWNGGTGGVANAFIIPGSSAPTAADLQNPTWSSRSDLSVIKDCLGIAGAGRISSCSGCGSARAS